MQVQVLFVILIGQALFLVFLLSIYHYCFILVSSFAMLSLSRVGTPDLLHLFLLSVNLIINDIELRKENFY